MNPDFSDLPDIPWVQILSHLSLSDRASVARTCYRLNCAFKHPSLWHTVEILLLGDLNRFRNSQSPVIMPECYLTMIQRFGTYFQDLTLIFAGFLKRIPTACKAVIEALAVNCRLESLTLEVGGIVTKLDLVTQVPRRGDLGTVAQLIQEAFRLKSFSLRSWPTYPGLETVNILQTLRENPRLVDLEKLSLFWNSANHGTWATLNAQLPTPDEILHTVQHFRSLHTLCLRSTMLSNDAILELAHPGHTPIQRLGILVTYSSHDRSQGLPDVTSHAWSKLLGHSPDLGVDVTVANRIPYVELAGFLKPEMPLTSISFMRYARCGTADIASLNDKYHKKLRKFVDYSDTADADVELVNLVNKCKSLDCFVFNGRLYCQTVLSLADSRGQHWYRFKVNTDNVITKMLPEDYDPDYIIRKSASGECYIARHVHEYESEEEHEAKINEMIARVSQAIGQRWLPLGQDAVQPAVGETQIVTVKAFQAAEAAS